MQSSKHATVDTVMRLISVHGGFISCCVKSKKKMIFAQTRFYIFTPSASEIAGGIEVAARRDHGAAADASAGRQHH